MTKAIPLMIQGTASNVGKSIVVTALCRIFSDLDYKTAPFKSQNMSLNSYITNDGKEIGRAQGIQAEAAGIAATTDMNPILLKPSGDQAAQIVVHGQPAANLTGRSYRSDFYEIGLQVVKQAYQTLAEQYERIIIEGAGSPAEINLNDRELVNMRVARIANAPVILVADIDRGGVFASLVGTLQLLDVADRERVIGVIINKFRGDLSLLQAGLDWFESYTGKPVLGVIPYLENLWIDAEDSLAMDRYLSNTAAKEIDIAVIQYPRISNFTDLDPLLAETDCSVRFVSEREQLGNPDLIIFPGSKNTIEDLQFLRETGLEQAVLQKHRQNQTWLIGICGGYQMLGKRIMDPYGMESKTKSVPGMGIIPIETKLLMNKTTVQSTGYVQFMNEDMEVHGYEIHMGQSQPTDTFLPFIQMNDRTDGIFDQRNRILGTYFHGIFDNDRFRNTFLNQIRSAKGILPKQQQVSFEQLKHQSYRRLAEHVKNHLDLDQIQQKMFEFANFKIK